MNERITAYLNEVYGNETEDMVNLSQLVEAFEQKYKTRVEDILISEDCMNVNTGGRDEYLSLNSEGVVFDVMALFCENYVAFISVQPEKTRVSHFSPYSSINGVQFNDSDNYMIFCGTYHLEKVKGHPHWAMDVIRAHILPRFK